MNKGQAIDRPSLIFIQKLSTNCLLHYEQELKEGIELVKKVISLHFAKNRNF
jgi:hypothetical protein